MTWVVVYLIDQRQPPLVTVRGLSAQHVRLRHGPPPDNGSHAHHGPSLYRAATGFRLVSMVSRLRTCGL